VPVLLVSTDPVVAKARNPDPSTISVHIAQESVKVDPERILVGLTPRRVRIGAVESCMMMVRVACPELPAWSILV
jgi:hypothetical protein